MLLSLRKLTSEFNKLLSLRSQPLKRFLAFEILLLL